MAVRRLWFALGALALIAIFGALRRELGIHLEPESIRDAVGRLGVWGPLVFVGIVALRIPLGVPSALALIGGGLVFGSVEGTLYGAAGLLISAIAVFLVSRWAGRDVIESRVPPRLRYLVDLAGSRVGALFVALGTAYPLSPITSFPLVAGVTGMAMPVFALAAATGSLGRAALYTYFGSRLVEADPGELIGAGALLLAAMVAPLALPAPRAWLFQAFERRDGS
ncbi:MAG TPA: VTT domain-containing protein [Myxococcota bacterium]|nr:VTT domain-containing protein [Myxococcota bacterium]